MSSADTPSTPSKNPHIKESDSSLSPAHTPEKLRVRQGEDVDIPDSSPASFNQIQQGILSREEALQLQIRIAVLENELSHARRAQEAAMNGTIQIVRAFSTSLTLGNGAFLQHSNVEELQIQNLRLKQENDRLWLLVGAAATKSRQEDHVIGNPGVTEMSFARLFDPTESFNPQLRGNKVAGTSNAQGCYVLEKDFGGASKTEGRVVDVQRKSFDSNSSTMPNTPRNPAQDVSKPSVPRSKEHFNRVISSKAVSYDDIGLPSLDDILDDVPQSRVSRFDDDLPIEEQIVQNLNPAVALVDLPKPVSLVTGFQIAGSFRGDQYDACLATWKADGNPASSRQDPDHRISSDYDRGDHSGPRSEDESFDSLKNQSFISREEREATIEEHQRSMRREDNDRAFPDFFRYGIQYLPRAGETNYSRTIVISPLPQSMRLLDLLNRVRGGPIVSSMLFSGRAMNNLGGNTAVIQFLNESSANDYQSYAETHPNIFSDKEVKVKFIETPTYHQYSTIRLMRDRGSTRLVVVDNPPRGLQLESLRRDITAGNPWRAAALLDLWVDGEPDSFGGQRLVLEFSSVNAAKFAFAILSHWERYRLLKVGFALDPCAGPVEELELPLLERQHYLPSISDFGDDRDLAQEMNIQQQVLNLQRKRLAVWSNNKVENNERKRLAALNNIKVEIPSFSGEGITSGTNWADEVNGEFDDANTFPSRHSDDEVVEKEGEVDDTTPSLCKAMATRVIKEEIASIFVVEESEDNMGRKLQKRRPTYAHTGSKYATILPAFSDSVTTSAGKERTFGGTSVEASISPLHRIPSYSLLSASRYCNGANESHH
ncbi:hypothetical protein B0O99DRAFT_605190 [Bisporella sp. PMI_857]|nr:hypothetical protein B0O99DRAFT_605190 [Bisporella sp. PMI_857]